MKESKLLGFLGIVFAYALVILVALHQNAMIGGGKMFSIKNIIGVNLFFIIVIPVIYIIRKYLFKRKD